MADLYILEHCIEIDDDDNEDYKLIGLFTTRKKAEKALELVRQKPGFKDYPDDFFYLGSLEIGMLNWTGGWAVWSDNDEEDEEE